ncbi:MAG: hypothetical protein EZS28_019854, partial [Streblomastix strix]
SWIRSKEAYDAETSGKGLIEKEIPCVVCVIC